MRIQRFGHVSENPEGRLLILGFTFDGEGIVDNRPLEVQMLEAIISRLVEEYRRETGPQP